MIAILAAALAASAPTPPATPSCLGRHLATIEADGAVSAGSLPAVVAAARRGAQLRVGWQIGPRDAPIVLHWQDARFITVFEGHVFTQVGDIHRQVPLVGQGHIELSPEWRTWTATVGTNGRLVGRDHTEATPREMRVVTYWCLAG